MADLDDPHLRPDRQQRNDAAGAAGLVDDGVREWIRDPGACLEPETECLGVGERSVGQVGPDLIVACERRPQIGAVARRIELLDPAETAPQYDYVRLAGGARIDQGPDRLLGDRIGQYSWCHDAARCSPPTVRCSMMMGVFMIVVVIMVVVVIRSRRL